MAERNNYVNASYKEEKLLEPMNGIPVLIATIILFIASIAVIVFASIHIESAKTTHLSLTIAVTAIIVSSLYFTLIFPILLAGLKAVNPNEAAVYVLFGKYYGTIATPGFYFINPFCSMINPSAAQEPKATVPATVNGQQQNISVGQRSKKVSLKATTLNNDKQKINDKDGNPIDIGVVVIWRVINATKAVFEVDNYKTYLSTQSDAAIRHVARLYPYDINDDEEKSLRGSSNEVAEELKRELQGRVAPAGIEIIETRISHLAYAQEIAAAMLQRQQADAIIAARQKIVEGAVGMVEMALDKLSEKEIVILDDERKAAMVSNLLVVLCGNKDAQPIVNSGTIY